ncbi:MAG: type II toxin-antitoxin system prevent-host-death family antitoxin [Proteobacteria bacterium]|nr:type II toxin-antitoxin system prevent-host-death family antitoxin [Pseudomonadota bacterium]
MSKVKVTELRQNLPAYLARVRCGEEIEVMVHGKVVARLVPEADRREAARRHLSELRRNGARIIGDVIRMPKETWEAER